MPLKLPLWANSRNLPVFNCKNLMPVKFKCFRLFEEGVLLGTVNIELRFWESYPDLVMLCPISIIAGMGRAKIDGDLSAVLMSLYRLVDFDNGFVVNDRLLTCLTDVTAHA